MPVNYADNTLGTARGLSITATTRTLTDYIGSLDNNDYYRFSFNQRSSFSMTLDGMSGNADVQLLNSSGAIVAGSYNSGRANEAIKTQLNAGDYYVQVYSSSDSTKYNLSFKANRVDAYESNNTMNTAYQLGSLSGTRNLNASIGGTDTNDYYSFTVGTASNFSLSMTKLSANADVQLLNSRGDVVASSAKSGKNAESIVSTLDAGTYYIRVYPYNGSNTNYSLNLNANPVETPSAAKWTFLVYMAGDSLESFGIEDFQEMSAVGSTANVNIVAQFDRTAEYTTAYGNWTDTRRGMIRSGDTPSLSWGSSIGEVNMGDANTLMNFINWGTASYQAEHYALILWGHGSGFNVSYDDITGDSISAVELSSVLSSLSPNIDLVGTDACLMGMTEFAYQIRNNVSVFVGSQELEPGEGWHYTSVLSGLNANPIMTAAQLGTTIVNRYGQYYSNIGFNDVEETLSAINLVALRSSNPNNLSTALSQLATTIMNGATQMDLGRLQGYRDSAGDFGQGYAPEYRDLGMLLAGIANDMNMTVSISTAARTALSAYSGVIIQNYASIQQSTGLSINFQARGTAVDSSYNSSNLSFAADTAWDEFLRWWQTA